MLETLRAWFASPRRVDDASELQVGRVVVTGRVKAPEEPLISPIRGTECVAYTYRTVWRAPARGRSNERPLRTAEVYLPRFVLELGHGEVAITGKSDPPVSMEDHRSAANAALDGFKGTEQLIREGDRIRIQGWAQRDGDGWAIVPSQVQLVEAKPSASRKVRRRR